MRVLIRLGRSPPAQPVFVRGPLYLGSIKSPQHLQSHPMRRFPYANSYLGLGNLSHSVAALSIDVCVPNRTASELQVTYPGQFREF